MKPKRVPELLFQLVVGRDNNSFAANYDGETRSGATVNVMIQVDTRTHTPLHDYLFDDLPSGELSPSGDNAVGGAPRSSISAPMK